MNLKIKKGDESYAPYLDLWVADKIRIDSDTLDSAAVTALYNAGAGRFLESI
jgi:hypothetical protein